MRAGLGSLVVGITDMKLTPGGRYLLGGFGCQSGQLCFATQLASVGKRIVVVVDQQSVQGAVVILSGGHSSS